MVGMTFGGVDATAVVVVTVVPVPIFDAVGLPLPRVSQTAVVPTAASAARRQATFTIELRRFTGRGGLIIRVAVLADPDRAPVTSP